MSANKCPNQKHLNNKVKQFTSEIRHKRINCPRDEARQVNVCSLNSQISPASKNRAPIDSSWERLKARWVSYLFLSWWVFFLWADYLRVGRFMSCHAILITQIPWDHVRFHLATRGHQGSWAHVRSPGTENVQNIFHKKHIAIPMTRGIDKRLTWP